MTLRRMIFQDGRLRGAIALCEVSSTRIAVAACEARLVTMVSRVHQCAVVGSRALDAEPRAVAFIASKLWALRDDGVLTRLAATDALTVEADLDLRAINATWLTSYNSHVIAPAGPCGIATISAASAILDQHDDVLDDVAFAVASAAGYLYAFDSLGGGAVLTVSSAGVMRIVTRFDATDCQGVLGGFIDGTDLVLAVAQGAAVVTFDISDPAEPVRSARETTASSILLNILADVDRTPLTDEFRADLGLAQWWPTHAGLVLTDATIALVHRRAGRMTATPTEDLSPTVDAGPDQAIGILTGVLAGSASDPDAGPSPLTTLWTQISGTAGVTFGNATSPTSTFTLPGLATYVLRLTATDGVTTVWDEMTITADTFFLLAETGSHLLAETGSSLLWQ